MLMPMLSCRPPVELLPTPQPLSSALLQLHFPSCGRGCMSCCAYSGMLLFLCRRRRRSLKPKLLQSGQVWPLPVRAQLMRQQQQELVAEALEVSEEELPQRRKLLQPLLLPPPNRLLWNAALALAVAVMRIEGHPSYPGLPRMHQHLRFKLRNRGPPRARTVTAAMHWQPQ